MVEFRKGQRVRVTYETTYLGKQGGRLRLAHPAFEDQLSVCQVLPEHVEPIDDPTSDPIGTVRLRREGLYVKVHDEDFSWCLIGQTDDRDFWRDNSGMKNDSSIVGAVPRSPADKPISTNPFA